MCRTWRCSAALGSTSSTNSLGPQPCLRSSYIRPGKKQGKGEGKEVRGVICTERERRLSQLPVTFLGKTKYSHFGLPTTRNKTGPTFMKKGGATKNYEILPYPRFLTSTCVMTEIAWRDRLMSSACELAGALGPYRSGVAKGRRAKRKEGQLGSRFVARPADHRTLNAFLPSTGNT